MTTTRTTTNARSGLGSNLGFFGNVYVRHIAFASPGDVIEGHSHDWDHVTLVSHGAVEVEWWDTAGERHVHYHTAPALIEVPAGRVHRMTAAQPETACWCIFAVRDLDGAVVGTVDPAQPVTGF